MTWDSSTFRASVVFSDSPGYCQSRGKNMSLGPWCIGTFGIINEGAIDVQLDLVLVMVSWQVFHIHFDFPVLAIAAQ